MRKIIYTLLDILLIFGAFAAVATIGGGKWFSSGIENYQPMDANWANVNLLRQAYAASDGTPVEGSSQAASPCSQQPGLPGPDWSAVSPVLTANYAPANFDPANYAAANQAAAMDATANQVGGTIQSACGSQTFAH